VRIFRCAPATSMTPRCSWISIIGCSFPG